MHFPWKSSQAVAHLMLRSALGATLVLIGISAYRNFAPFVANVTDGLGPIQYVVTAWAFVLPGLLIIGGALLAVGRYSWVAAWMCGLAVGSVPVGLVLKTVITGLPLPDMMAAGYPSIIWIIGIYLAMTPPEIVEEALMEAQNEEQASAE